MADSRRGARKQKGGSRDPEKERLFRELAGRLTAAGVTVRREELKQGHGFRVRSGSCRVNSDQLLLIDKRLTQDEQLTLIRERMRQMGMSEELQGGQAAS